MNTWLEFLRQYGYHSDREFEDAAGLTPGYLGRYLRGWYQVDNMRIATLKQMAAELTRRSGTTVSFLDVYYALTAASANHGEGAA